MSENESNSNSNNEDETSTQIAPTKLKSNKKKKSASETKSIKTKEKNKSTDKKSNIKKSNNKKLIDKNEKSSNDQAEDEGQDDDDNDDHGIVVSGGNWVHKCTVWLIDEYRHQIELGNGNDGGLKTAAWKLVLDSYNKRWKTKEGLTRLKNHIQKLKITYRAFDKIMDSSGAPGCDTTTGIVTADKEWWDKWIKADGNKDAIPIKNHGFPAYKAVGTIMPAKHLRANGAEGFGTQSKKRQSASPGTDDVDEEAANDSFPSESESIRRVATDHSEEDIKDDDDGDGSVSELDRPSKSTKGKAAVKTNNKKNPFARHLKIAKRQLAEEEEETPEMKFVRSKRGPIDRDASTSSGKRSRTTGPKLVSQSINRAVDLEEQAESDRIKIARLKLEQHPKRQEAMSIFNAGCNIELKPEHIYTVASKLKDDDVASFFFHMHEDHRWNWLKEEAGVLAEYQ